MALFRFIKYSSLLFLLGKYKHKVFRVVAVLLLAAVTALLYGDVEAYLAREHPDTVVYALLAKIVIVYGALAFVLWQFRPASGLASASPTGKAGRPREQAVDRPHTAAPTGWRSSLIWTATIVCAGEPPILSIAATSGCQVSCVLPTQDACPRLWCPTAPR